MKKIKKPKQPPTKEIMSLVNQHVKGPLAGFLMEQIRASTTKKRGHKWSDDNKRLALSLYHQSPKCYRLLMKVLCLPSISTLKRVYQSVDIRPGFNQGVLDAMKQVVANMSSKQRMCALVFDEMSIKKNMTYDVKNDCVEGFQDLGSLGRKAQVANHAGVFMVRGLVDKWKQPVSYVLSSSTVEASDLKKLILLCLSEMTEVGLDVKVVICDQGTNNRSMLEKLGVSIDQPFFMHEGKKVYAMYDPPHLVKSVRNNLASSGFTVDGSEIKWDYITQFFAEDSTRQIRVAPKVSQKHVDLTGFSKMRVYLATQILSHSVAVGITMMVEAGKLPDEASATAEFIEVMDNLFNVFNSSGLADAHEMRRALKKDSPHHSYLAKCADLFSRLKPSGKEKSLPCIEGWRLSIAALQQLWQDLQAGGLEYLITRRLNQDCLENFFSVMRGRGGHRDNPDAQQFRADYRSSVVNQLFAVVVVCP